MFSFFFFSIFSACSRSFSFWIVSLLCFGDMSWLLTTAWAPLFMWVFILLGSTFLRGVSEKSVWEIYSLTVLDFKFEELRCSSSILVTSSNFLKVENWCLFVWVGDCIKLVSWELNWKTLEDGLKGLRTSTIENIWFLTESNWFVKLSWLCPEFWPRVGASSSKTTYFTSNVFWVVNWGEIFWVANSGDFLICIGKKAWVVKGYKSSSIYVWPTFSLSKEISGVFFVSVFGITCALFCLFWK